MLHAVPADAARRARRLLAHVVGPLAAVTALAGAAGAAAGRPASAVPVVVAAAPASAPAAARPGKRSTKKAANKKTAKKSAAAAKAAKRSAKRSPSRATPSRATGRSAKRSGARVATRPAARAAGLRAERAERTARDVTRRSEQPDGARAAASAARVVIPVVTLASAAPAMAAPVRAPAMAGAGPLPDTLAGRSGKLRARWVVPSTTGLFTYLRRLFGDSSAAPGVYRASPAGDGVPRPFTYIAMLPFAEKVDGRIGGYRMGFWPGESRRGDAEFASSRGSRYAPPAGFIQVTADNAETPVSEHFRLRDFLTHDQARVWPKYLALDAGLVDKLELVLDDLRARGYRADRLHVMSGFRTPQYNRGGGDTRGRAEQSRHQYGDAADVWVENGNGTMADLNGDGRVDVRDASVLAESAERVEARHPALVGGVGVYHGTRAHGPFVHIDTRGSRARWGAG